jgi:RNA polymerase sigma-70 factor, ECF subfamily
MVRRFGAARLQPGSTDLSRATDSSAALDLRSTKAGLEEQALAALYAEHSAAVRAFIRTYASDPHRVEDVLQETFLRTWRHIDRVQLADGNPRSYLFTTARNILTDEWRAQSRQPQLVHDENRLAVAPTEDTVEATLEALTINEALTRLSFEHREVIQTLYYDGLTVTEAAKRLGVATGTVKSRSYYAVRALRTAFDEMGILR